MSSSQALLADFVFDGTTVKQDVAVVLEGSRIAGVVPQADLSISMPSHRLPKGAWLAPGFIDIQVNGGGDVLFNDDPTPEGIRAIATAHRRFGTTALLPTLISDTPQITRAAISAVQALGGSDPSILGLHLEGPFLSPEKPGVHAIDRIRSPDADDETMLTQEGLALMVMTLAPERVPKGFIGRLNQVGVRICLGHSMATYEETRAAMAEGLVGFTHLFNAMRPLASREPGPIGAALESPDAWFGMIVDGFHVDPALLRLALRGRAHPMLVTDAMPPVGGKRASFNLYGEPVSCRKGMCLRGDGALAGSALNMITAVHNCVQLLDVPLEAALTFASSNPAGFLGIDSWLGHLAAGYRADIVAIDPSKMNVLGVWISGRAYDVRDECISRNP
jgi:N-acetylglucosamine-6-phosphate deacetylase